MKAIIFGGTGQDGFYLTKLLHSKNIGVASVARNGATISGDVGEYIFVERIIRQLNPQIIFNFAANSSTKHDSLFENHHTISTGTLNILEVVKKYVPECKVFLSGSALQFENSGFPINEKTPFSAPNPYTFSRIHSVYAGRYYRSLGMLVYVGYFFNHESPLRAERHVSKMISEAARRISKGSNESITIGALAVRKEWSFAGDVVNAVWKLVDQSEIFEAVIGSGKAYSIKDYVQNCFNLIGKDWQSYVKEKEAFKPEYEILVSDPALIKSLGWEPKISFEHLAELMMTNNLSV